MKKWLFPMVGSAILSLQLNAWKEVSIFKPWFTTSSALENRSRGTDRRLKKEKSVQQLDGMGISCHDGDTCRVKITEKEVWKIRLAGIDAPELKQHLGPESQRQLQKMIQDQKLRLECEGMSFDRHTCRIFVGAEDVGEKMIKEGLAWEAPQYSKNRYVQSLNLAKNEKKGIWGTPGSVSPYCFRKPTSKHCKNRQDYMP